MNSLVKWHQVKLKPSRTILAGWVFGPTGVISLKVVFLSAFEGYSLQIFMFAGAVDEFFSSELTFLCKINSFFGCLG
jgi:hypothetical protein